ncbi:hypothetical protein CRG98_013925 [Punica granatum]|uniref:Uncharacterized protein n=1 Tax=Punica granatum TaxID=22663 RepID=A0A2I0KBQ4_PUNGR|nr:hypothetical protein CRG98_013925 [Punica granatum]
MTLGRIVAMGVDELNNGCRAAIFLGIHGQLGAQSASFPTAHLSAFAFPEEAEVAKKAILVIIHILMAPLYAINSYVSTIDYQGSKTAFTFLDSIKECYEALVIHPLSYNNLHGLQISLLYHSVVRNRGTKLRKKANLTFYLQLEHSTRRDQRKTDSPLVSHGSLSASLCPLKSRDTEASKELDLAVFGPLPGVLHLDDHFSTSRDIPGWLSQTFAMIYDVFVTLALYMLLVFYHVLLRSCNHTSPSLSSYASKGSNSSAFGRIFWSIGAFALNSADESEFSRSFVQGIVLKIWA